MYRRRWIFCSAYAKKGTSFVSITPVAELEWHVGDFRFVYVPVVNDDVLYHWVNLADAYRRNGNLIAPPRYGRLLFHALRSLTDRIAPTVMGIDEYVNLRTLFATMDFNWPRDRAHIELIEAYNRCVIESHGDSSICVELPVTPDYAQDR